MKRISLACALVAVILLALGCKSNQAKQEELMLKKTEFSKVSLLQIQEMLKDFGDRLTFSIKAAANRIVEEHPDLEIRKRTVYWKLVTIPNLRRSLYQDAPLIGLIDSWAFCVQMVDYFESGEGKNVFGNCTHIALETSQALEKDIQQLAARAIEEEYFTEWQAGIENFAKHYPLTGLVGRYSARPELLQASDSGRLKWITELPLAPFRAFMSDTARAIMEFNLVADRFAEQLRFMPDDVQWHLELLLYDIEERDTTRAAVKSTEEVASSARTFADAAQQMADTADRLPAELEERIKSVIEEFDAQQEGIQGTLQETRSVLVETKEALASAEEFSRSASVFIDGVTTAGKSWETAVVAFQGVLDDLLPEEEAEPEPAEVQSDEEGGFDIKDYEQTAVKTREAVVELRALTADLNALIGSVETESLLRRIWIYLILLAAAFFTLLLIYRISASRLARKG